MIVNSNVETIHTFKNLEFRKTKTLIKSIGDHYYEIVQWENSESLGNICFTLLQWLPCSEGWDIKFLGNRPFNYVNEFGVNEFWSFLDYCQGYLNNEFRFKENTACM